MRQLLVDQANAIALIKQVLVNFKKLQAKGKRHISQDEGSTLGFEGTLEQDSTTE